MTRFVVSKSETAIFHVPGRLVVERGEAGHRLVQSLDERACTRRRHRRGKLHREQKLGPVGEQAARSEDVVVVRELRHGDERPRDAVRSDRKGLGGSRRGVAGPLAVAVRG